MAQNFLVGTAVYTVKLHEQQTQQFLKIGQDIWRNRQRVVDGDVVEQDRLIMAHFLRQKVGQEGIGEADDQTIQVNAGDELVHLPLGDEVKRVGLDGQLTAVDSMFALARAHPQDFLEVVAVRLFMGFQRIGFDDERPYQKITLRLGEGLGGEGVALFSHRFLI